MPAKSTHTETDTLLASALLGFKGNAGGASAPRITSAKQDEPSLPAAKSVSDTSTATSPVQTKQESEDKKPVVPSSSLAGRFASANPASRSRHVANSANAGVNPVVTNPIATTPTSLASSVPASNVPSASTTASSGSSRPELVEEALRSKPQRGRKRDNLTLQERQELTRTRNREHARSTRNRKKARYQELEEKEVALQELQEQLQLHRARRQTVLQFLQVRQDMVLRLVESPTVSPLPEGGVNHVMDSLDDFVFRHDWYETEPWTRAVRGLHGMVQFDERLIRQTRESHGQPRQLTYRTKSADSIALSLNDTAYAEAQVCLPLSSQPLLSANLVLSFAPHSSKVVAVQWRTLDTGFGDDKSMHPGRHVVVAPVQEEEEPHQAVAAQAPHNHDDEERLDKQNSYPSVVSLDPAVFDGPDLSF